MIAQNIAYQLEKGEDQHEHDKGGQHQEEGVEELAHNVLVEDARKDMAGFGAAGVRLKPVKEA